MTDRLVRGALMLVVALTPGCDDGEDDEGGSGADTGGADGLAMCAGSYAGTYTGDDMGVASADLAADGALTVTFTTSVGPTNAQGMVTADGDVSGTEGATSITGSLSFGNCSMSGTWVTEGFGGGDWSMQLD
jgi:hypothetical protein